MRRTPDNAATSRRILFAWRLVLSALLLTWAWSIGALVGQRELVAIAHRLLP